MVIKKKKKKKNLEQISKDFKNFKQIWRNKIFLIKFLF